MNFTTQFLEYANKNPFLVAAQDQNQLGSICNKLLAADKFVLPYDGDTGVKIDASLTPLLRMPYPIMVFEYTCQESNVAENISAPKRLALFTELTPTKVEVQVMYGQNDKWFLIPIVAEINFGEQDCIDTGRVKGNFFTSCHTLFDGIQKNSGVSPDVLTDMLIGDLSEEICNGVSAIACLNAKNVSTVTIPAPDKLNKKRKEKNRVLFFEYKTLSIFLGDAILSARPRDRNRLASLLAKPGVRLSKVRGHFKRRNGNLYWWSFHLRGSKQLGVIEKQYNLVNPN